MREHWREEKRRVGPASTEGTVPLEIGKACWPAAQAHIY